MTVFRLLAAALLSSILQIVPLGEARAQDGASGTRTCAPQDTREFEEELAQFFLFFCDRGQGFMIELNEARGAGGAIAEDMILLSRVVTKLKTGEPLSDRDTRFLVESLRRDQVMVDAYAAAITSTLFRDRKQKICRDRYASPEARQETERLKEDIKETIRCGARF